MNKFQNWLKENWFKLLIGFSVVLVGIGISYHYVIDVPKQEALELQMKQDQIITDKDAVVQQSAIQKKALARCLADSYISYMSAWALSCKELSQGLTALCSRYVSDGTFRNINECLSLRPDASGSEKCNLPTNTANSIKSDWKDNNDMCYKLNLVL